jgi:phospholipase C
LAGVATPDLGRGQNQSGAETGVPTLVNGSVQLTGSVLLPPPEESGIEHVVVVTMENRSFDHFLGWRAGADGLPPGLMYPDRKGVSHSSHPLAPDFTGCPHPSPDHSYDQSSVAYDDGKMDGRNERVAQAVEVPSGALNAATSHRRPNPDYFCPNIPM